MNTETLVGLALAALTACAVATFVFGPAPRSESTAGREFQSLTGGRIELRSDEGYPEQDRQHGEW